MKAERQTEGVIEIIKDVSTKEFTKANGDKGRIHSIGIKLEKGEWYNIQSFLTADVCNEVLNKTNGGKFVKGDSVTFTEQSTDKDQKYWNIVKIVANDQPVVETVKTNDEIAKEQGVDIGKVESNDENIIEKQCCLKCASMLGGIQTKEECLKVAQWFYQMINIRWLK